MKALTPVIIMCIFVLTSPGYFLGAENVLTPLGPEGGETMDIAFDPHNNGVVYASVYCGGIYRSLDGGKNWQLFVPIGEVGGYSADFVIAPDDTDIFYSAGNGVYKSEDGGATWQDINPVPETINARTFLVDVKNPNTIFVGSETGIFKSINRGSDWTSINSGLTNLNISSLTIGSSNPQVLYAGSWEVPGIFKSENGGNTWSVVYSGLTGSHIMKIVVSPTNSDTVFANDYNVGLLKSTDGGDTWEKVLDNCTEIALDPVASDIIYVSAHVEGLYKSVDGGSSWAFLSDGFTYGGGGGYIAINPFDNSNIFVGTEAGIFRSKNGGWLWYEANSGIKNVYVKALAIAPTNPDAMYAGCDGALYITTNAGNTWQVSLDGITRHDIWGIAVDPVSSNVVYCSENYSSIYKSIDYGETWSEINNGIPEEVGVPRSIVIDPGNTNIVYAGMALDPHERQNPRGIFKSIDGGATWIEFNTGLTHPDVRTLIIDPSDTMILYAGTGGGGVFKTVNGAADWNAVNNGLTNLNLRALAIASGNTNILYAGTYGGGIFRSMDGGVDWTPMNAGLIDKKINCIAVDRSNNNQVFAGSYDGRFYRSINGGQSWWAFDLDLPGIESIVASPSNSNELYIGSAGKGVNLLEIEPAAITVTSPNGGENLAAGTLHSITWTAGGIVDTVKIEYSTDNGGSWLSIESSTPNDGSYSWTVPGIVSTQCLVRIGEAFVGTPADTSDAVFSIIEPVSPEISINRTQYYFGATTAGVVTPPQTFLIDNSSGGVLEWSITGDAGWINCTPTAGTGPGIVDISIDPSGLSVGTHGGTISLSAPGAINSPQIVDVTLEVYKTGKSEAPFGRFSTPVDGSTVMGSIPVTGWVLDDIGVESIKIYRGDVGSLVYIGDAVFVEGARPDVEQANPRYPMNYKAGWGYMMLTAFLPNAGNGTFKLHAVAADAEGNRVTIGTKTIAGDNVNAVKPFGAIDIPLQGGTASGSDFINWGWVLTPQPNSIPTDGSTIDVYVDGVNLGHPNYNIYRQDIAGFFPDCTNSNGAVGYFPLDTANYENGIHTIQWTAVDNASNADGIGSRYFTIWNTENKRKGRGKMVYSSSQISKIPVDAFSNSIRIKRESGKNRQTGIIHADEKGIFRIKIEELERVEIELSHKPSVIAGYSLIGNEFRSLPVGSTLETGTGKFYWQPGPGFVGEYRFVFIEKSEDNRTCRKCLIVGIKPKFGKGS